MADASPRSPASPVPSGLPGLPLKVRLLFKAPGHDAVAFDVHQESFLIGTVAGCDLRLPAADLPPLVCVLTPHSKGLHVRKLAPAQLVLLDGQPCSEGVLPSGSRLAVGPFEVRCECSWPSGARVTPAGDPSTAPLPEQRRMLEEGIRKLAAAQKQFDEDRHDWEQDAERQAETLAVRSRHLLEREKELATARNRLEAELAQVEARAKSFADRERALADAESRMEQERAALTADVERFREQQSRMQGHYQKKRDAMAALKQSVRRAAAKVQKEKRQLTTDQGMIRLRAEQLAQQDGDLRKEQQETDERAKAIASEKHFVEEWQRELEREHGERRARLDAEQGRLAAEADRLADLQRQYTADLVRLDRAEADLQERQDALLKHAKEVEGRATALNSSAGTLEEQSKEAEAWETQLRQREEAIGRREQALGEQERALGDRASGMETQQTLLATLRGKVERIRGELVEREQQLTAERLRLDEMETRLEAASRNVHERAAALRREEERWQTERQAVEARAAKAEQSAAGFTALEAALAEQRDALERERQAFAEEQARLSQLRERITLRADRIHTVRRRLLGKHRALKERAQQLLQSEQVCQNLQEQLRVRLDGFAERERNLTELERVQQESTAAAEQKLKDVVIRETALGAAENSLHVATERHAQAATEETEALVERRRELDSRSHLLETERQELAQERESLGVLKQQVQTELDALRRESDEMLQRLPELTLQAHAALDRLGSARLQLREHLQEVNSYAHQCHDERAAALQEATAAAERLRADHHQLAQAREEHRLAVAAFRQQLSEWKVQLAEMKQLAAFNQAAMQRRQAELSEQRLSLEEKTHRLAEKAERLEHQHQDVSVRKDELTRQLGDMQSWYRQKLRDLAARRLVLPEPTPEGGADGTAGVAATAPVLLPLWSHLDERDQQLAKRLLDMGLIEQATLVSLVESASKHGGLLRDALLDGEYLTPYQLDIIESGNLDALSFGSLRIIDRLRLTPLESVYRVFDGGRGVEALLRHLASAVDEKRKQDFRDRFSEAARVRHANIAATLDVIELEGRPAAVQEWIDGAPSSEWLEFAAAPGVCLQLMRQAAAGLDAVHAAGQAHGHLHSGRLLLTDRGELKICGLGEPAWLFPDPVVAALPKNRAAATPADDLQALGQMAGVWLASALGGRLAPRGLDVAQAVVDRLLGRGGHAPFRTAADLASWIDDNATEALDQGRSAWEHLLAFLKERLQPLDLPQKQSA